MAVVVEASDDDIYCSSTSAAQRTPVDGGALAPHGEWRKDNPAD